MGPVVVGLVVVGPVVVGPVVVGLVVVGPVGTVGVVLASFIAPTKKEVIFVASYIFWFGTPK